MLFPTELSKFHVNNSSEFAKYLCKYQMMTNDIRLTLHFFGFSYNRTVKAIQCRIFRYFKLFGIILIAIYFEFLLNIKFQINLVILIELQRDITGMDNIVQSGRVSSLILNIHNFFLNKNFCSDSFARDVF